MDGSFLEMVLKHVVYRSPSSMRDQYHVANNWLGRQMQNRLNGAGVTWDSLVAWSVRALTSGRPEVNTLVVPFNDKCHWSVFVIESGKTYHLDSLDLLHESQYARDFLAAVHLGWAHVKGHEPGSRAWRELAMRRAVRVACPTQRGVWECGYVACMRFWEYFLWRGQQIEGEIIHPLLSKWLARLACLHVP